MKFFPGMQYGSVALTAYILSASDEAWLPFTRSKIQHSRWIKAICRRTVTASRCCYAWRSVVYRKIMALEALTRFDKSVAQLKNYDLHAELLPHSTLIELVQVLSRIQDDPKLSSLKSKPSISCRHDCAPIGDPYGLAGEEYNRIASLLSRPDGNAARLLLLALKNKYWSTIHVRMLEGG
jgi:hypothetical protein